MLSQYDRRRLEMISNQLQIEDPQFARAMREWKPPIPVTPRPRRWPMVVVVSVCLLVVVAGIASGTVSVVLLGAVTLGGAMVWSRYTRPTGISDLP